MLLSAIPLGELKDPKKTTLIGPVPAANLNTFVEGLSKIEPPKVKLKQLSFETDATMRDEYARRKMHEMINGGGANPLNQLLKEIQMRKIADEFKMQQIRNLELRDQAEIIRASELMGVMPGTIRNMEMLNSDLNDRRNARLADLASVHTPESMANFHMRRMLGLPDDTASHRSDQISTFSAVQESLTPTRPSTEVIVEVAENIANRPVEPGQTDYEEPGEVANGMIMSGAGAPLPREEEDIHLRLMQEITNPYRRGPVTLNIESEPAKQQWRYVYDRRDKLGDIGGFLQETYSSATNKKYYDQIIINLAERLMRTDPMTYEREFADVAPSELVDQTNQSASKIASKVKRIGRLMMLNYEDSASIPPVAEPGKPVRQSEILQLALARRMKNIKPKDDSSSSSEWSEREDIRERGKRDKARLPPPPSQRKK